MKSPKITALTKAENYDMSNNNRSSGENYVTMSNALTRAGHGLTLAEKRLVMLSASKLDSYTFTRYDEPPISKVTASEYAELYQVDINTAYEQLESSAKNLYERSITFFEPAHKRKGKEISLTTVKMRWVGSVKYHKKEGWVELAWWYPLLPHLLNLKKQFTTYQLQQATALKCSYSWRLLELLMRFKSTGWAEYTIEDLHTSLDVTAKMREDFGQVKRRIIEPAVKELTEKGGWLIEWKMIKAGRKVKAVTFKFEKNPQMSIFELGA
jgi:plasmid replication initiation protein